VSERREDQARITDVLAPFVIRPAGQWRILRRKFVAALTCSSDDLRSST
jgi:hypothetical protein